MKRVWFAVAFIVIAVCLCIGEQHYINRFYHEMSDKITLAKSYAETEDNALLSKEIDEIKRYWYQHNNLMFTMTNHGVLDELSARIRALDAQHIENGLNEAEAMLNVFYENQKITFANIF